MPVREVDVEFERSASEADDGVTRCCDVGHGLRDEFDYPRIGRLERIDPVDGEVDDTAAYGGASHTAKANVWVVNHMTVGL